MFGATGIVKNSNKEKYVCSGYRIEFDRKGEWSLTMTMLEMLKCLALIIVHHLMLIISRIIFKH